MGNISPFSPFHFSKSAIQNFIPHIGRDNVRQSLKIVPLCVNRFSRSRQWHSPSIYPLLAICQILNIAQFALIGLYAVILNCQRATPFFKGTRVLSHIFSPRSIPPVKKLKIFFLCFLALRTRARTGEIGKSAAPTPSPCPHPHIKSPTLLSSRLALSVPFPPFQNRVRATVEPFCVLRSVGTMDLSSLGQNAVEVPSRASRAIGENRGSWHGLCLSPRHIFADAKRRPLPVGEGRCRQRPICAHARTTRATAAVSRVGR